MSAERRSLLAGRNTRPLTGQEIRRVANIFIAMNERVNAQFDPNGYTRFRVSADADGNDFGEILYGNDIYPGASTVDPNSAMMVEAAVAHELTHYARWHDKQELPPGPLDMLDEALTSLEAILHYERKLDSTAIIQLVRDAVQRIYLYIGGVEHPSE